MNYTKGHWKTVEINYYIYNVCTDGPGPHRYAQVADCRGVDRAANAQLIAAAPDLYEAAKALLACLDMSALSNDEVEGVNNLYNALAKAEGK